MKGYVHVTCDQVKDAIDGFNKELAFGRVIRDKGIAAYYEKFYTNGNRLVKWWHRKKTKMGFARAHTNNVWGSWADILYEVLTEEECDRLLWWSYNNTSDISPLECLLSQSNGGLMLVDDKMAAAIQKYRGFNK